MVDFFDENSCRFCLRPACDEWFSETDSFNYFKCTGYSVKLDDIPRKSCKNCILLLESFRKFQDESKIVEEKLMQGPPTVKEEVDDETFAEEPFIEDPEINILTEDESKEKIKKELKDRVACEMCVGKTFATKDCLRKHTKKVHLNIKPKKTTIFECFYCVEIFQTHKERKVHLEAMHKDKDKKERSYMCSICGKIFKSIEYLKRHNECVHVLLEYFCDICNNQQPIRGKVRLYEHMRYRHLRKPEVLALKYSCHICGKIFNHSNSRRLHILRIHTEQKSLPFQCTICTKAFVTKQAFKAHYRTHTGEKNFLCHCGDKFGTSNHLKQHQKSVHEVFDVNCSVCGKHFTNERYLKQHLKIHNQNYTCPLCPLKTFSLTTTLRSHIKTNHPELPLPAPGTILKNFDWNQVFEEKQ